MDRATLFEARTYLAISANRERFPEHERNDEDEDGQEEHSTRGQRWREAWQCNGSGSGPGLGARVRQWHRERGRWRAITTADAMRVGRVAPEIRRGALLVHCVALVGKVRSVGVLTVYR